MNRVGRGGGHLGWKFTFGHLGNDQTFIIIARFNDDHIIHFHLFFF
jgi:hypothetical protein